MYTIEDSIRDEARTEGIAQGIAQGRAQGRAATQRETARNMLARGFTLELVRAISRKSVFDTGLASILS